MSSVIRFDDVARWFGDQVVLDGLSFQVEAGQAYALLGRNGTGKTTALRILLGFLAPHAGTATVLGRSGAELTPQDRERIGYVGEDHALPGGYTLPELLDYESVTRRRFDRPFVSAALERLGLMGEQKPINKLSRGQRAQVALLLAVAGRPDVLVFDDPALGLDVVMRRALLDIVIEQLAERGAAVLFSSHQLADVERLADRVGILVGGHLVVDATLDDLRQRVSQRFVQFREPRPANAASFDTMPGLLRATPRGGGFELTLLDADERAEEALVALGGDVGEVHVPNVEQLFLELTSRDEDRALVSGGSRWGRC